jgi:phosphate-selective porin
MNLIGGYSSRDRWIDKNGMMNSSLGFEFYRKFYADYGDFLTVDLQMRAAYDSKKNSRDAWGLEMHNAWFEYKLSQYAKIRGGHFDPSFGLEPVVDTHSTLLQTLAEQDIGFNKDWGVQMRGSFPKFDYEASLQLGSGMSIRRQDDSYLAALRIGTPQGRNLQGGFSILSGRTLETEGMRTFPKNKLLSGDAVNKKRVGLDGQYVYGPFLFKEEFAYGQNDKKDVLGYLTEIDYTLPSHQNLEFQLQYKSWINDIHLASSDDSTLTFGATYKLSQSTTLRAAFSHDFGMMYTKPEDRFVLQLYFLGA